MPRLEQPSAQGAALSPQKGDGPLTVGDPRVVQDLEAHLAALQRGQRPDRRQLLARYPELARELGACLNGLEAIHRLAPQLHAHSSAVAPGVRDPAEVQAVGTLGDFRIQREIGRGGMGVVYEAEQVSLGRKVALKVLPFAAMLDRRQLQRFQNEARAAASLDHPNIVHVHSVGCERGVHYFAMQYIEGQTLAQVIGQLRQASGLVPKEEENGKGAVSQLTCDLISGRFLGSDKKSSGDEPTAALATETPSPQPADPLADTDRKPQAHVSTKDSIRSREFFRSVVQLGIQAAEALEHAHQMGVVHRDIKPSNLMVDLGGHLWITDFGLAMIQAPSPLAGEGRGEGAALTMSGDVLGTLRYMSPEQAEGRHGVLDHHTDVYSLGVTLYELLTLQPAVTSTDRHEVIHQVAEEDARRPRQINRAIPADLETIVLKAMAKEPKARYATAAQLADDLKRFLADEPIRARRPSLAARAAKWSRRHRPVVWSAAVVLLMAAVLAGLLVWNRYERRAELERSVSQRLAGAEAVLESGDYAAADRHLAEARTRLDVAQYRAGPLRTAVDELAQRLAGRLYAQERLERFQEFRHHVHSYMYAISRTMRDRAQEDCRTALGMYGAWEEGSWKQRPEYQYLTAKQQAVLDEGIVELLFVSARLEIERAKQQSDPAKRAESYRRAIGALAKIETHHRSVPSLSRWTAASWRGLGENEKAEAADARADSNPPRTALDYFVQGEFYAEQDDWEQALESYWKALNLQPDHFLSILAAGVALVELEEYKAAETMLTGAIALNPQTTLAYVKRGTSRLEQGRIALGQFDFDTATELDPELAHTFMMRGISHYWQKGDKADLQKAFADLTEAIRIDPKYPRAYLNRGNVYKALGEDKKALADYNEAIRLDPKDPAANLSRGKLYRDLGEYEKALADHNEALRFHPGPGNYPGRGSKMGAYYGSRGVIYQKMGEYEKALADHNEAIRLDPKSAGAYNNRGNAYDEKGEFDKAIDDYSEAIRLDPKLAMAYNNRASAYWNKGEFDKAFDDYNEAIRLDPKFAMAYYNRGIVYRNKGEFDKAIADDSEAIRLDPKLAGAYNNRGITYGNKGEFDKAIDDYNEAIRVDPKCASAYYNRGNAYGNKREFDKAIADYSEAIRLDPNYFNAYFNRGNTYGSKGEFDKAIADYSEAIRLDPKFAPAYNNRGNAYRSKGEFDKAIADYNEAIRLDPKCAQANNGLAWLLATCPDARLRDADRAIELAQKAVKLSPDDGRIWNTLGVAQYRTGKWKAAIATLEKPMGLRSGGDSFDWFFLAMAHWQLGEKDKARQWYNKAVKWMDENKPEDEALRRFRAEAAELLGVKETMNDEG